MEFIFVSNGTDHLHVYCTIALLGKSTPNTDTSNKAILYLVFFIVENRNFAGKCGLRFESVQCYLPTLPEKKLH